MPIQSHMPTERSWNAGRGPELQGLDVTTRNLSRLAQSKPQFQSRFTRYWCLRVWAWTGCVFALSGCSPSPPPTANRPETMASGVVMPEGSSLDPVTAPGLEGQHFVAPLADAYRRLDPSADGWETEALSQAAQDQLNGLAGLFESSQKPALSSAADVVAAEFACAGMRPQVLDDVLTDDAFRVRRGRFESDTERGLSPVSPQFVGPEGFLTAYQAMMAGCGMQKAEHVKFKITRVQIDETDGLMDVLFHANGMSAEGPVEISAQWHTRWREADGAKPQLLAIQLADYEEVIYQSDQQYVYVDGTESLLSGNASYRQQVLRGTDYWRDRIPKVLGIDVVGNHGLAVGDVNGDDLDDLYMCQQGGLPNRLYLQQPDGTLVDATEVSGADWLDYCASALLVDLDNDGDRDLIVGQESRILFMSNDGEGRFQLRDSRLPVAAQTFSLSAADYDLDGDVDVYVCGYNPSASAPYGRGVMGEPMPYHDANNGGQNMLLRNEGELAVP